MVAFETVIRTVRRDDRGGSVWYTGEVDEARVEIDGEYKTVKEVATKRAELGELMRRLRDAGDRVLIEATHRAKAGQNGRIWDNFYIENARARSDASAPPPSDSEGWDKPKPTRSGGGKSPEESWQIALSVGSKLAVDSLPHLDEQARNDPEAQWKIALFWATRIFATPVPDPQPPQPDPSLVWPDQDEDIPF